MGVGQCNHDHSIRPIYLAGYALHCTKVDRPVVSALYSCCCVSCFGLVS